MPIKFSDYVKIENIKILVLNHLSRMGLGKEVQAMSDEEVDKIISMMAVLGEELGAQTNDMNRIEMLIGYIIVLWTKLLVSYGASPEEL